MVPPAWVNWFPTSSFKGAVPRSSALRFNFKLTDLLQKARGILCRPWWLTGTLAHLFYSDYNPELLHWLLSLFLDFFFKVKFASWLSLVIFLYAWPDGTFGDKTVQNKEVSLCSISSLHCFSDINISAHANSVSEPRNWDIQWWQLMREAPRAWWAWSHHLGPVWLDIQIRLCIFLFGYSLWL